MKAQTKLKPQARGVKRQDVSQPTKAGRDRSDPLGLVRQCLADMPDSSRKFLMGLPFSERAILALFWLELKDLRGDGRIDPTEMADTWMRAFEVLRTYGEAHRAAIWLADCRGAWPITGKKVLVLVERFADRIGWSPGSEPIMADDAGTVEYTGPN